MVCNGLIEIHMSNDMKVYIIMDGIDQFLNELFIKRKLPAFGVGTI